MSEQQMTMERSESIAKIGAALAKAQAAIEGAKKDAKNPHFKSNYATLASIWDACHKQLNAEGIAVVQMPRSADGGVEIETMLVHSSGEWISSRLTMPLADRATAQQVGSAVTYGRRYALAAMTGVAPDDDDGNAASEAPPERAPKRRVADPEPAAKAASDREYAEWTAKVAEQLDVLKELETVDPKRLRKDAKLPETGRLPLGSLRIFHDFLVERIGMATAGELAGEEMPLDFGKAAS
jgi:hypothetical protein